METMLNETKVEAAPEAKCAGPRVNEEVREMADRMEKRVNKVKAMVAEAVDDGKLAANRYVKRGQHAFEDGVEEAAHQVKRNPLTSLAIAFAAGAAFGLLVPHFSKKNGA